jgi:hypothetical protein
VRIDLHAIRRRALLCRWCKPERGAAGRPNTAADEQP